jgi:WD40 repeat protein/SAM-dependent methyltransferase
VRPGSSSQKKTPASPAVGRSNAKPAPASRTTRPSTAPSTRRSATPKRTTTRTPARAPAGKSTPTKPSATKSAGKPTKSPKTPGKSSKSPTTPRSAGSNSSSKKFTYKVSSTTVAVTAPSTYKESKKDKEQPKSELKIDYVYGYNGSLDKTSHNVAYSQDGQAAIYSVAATGVRLELDSLAQKFMLEHSDDITSIAVHPTKPLVATGQIDPKSKGATPYTIVWNSETMAKVGVFDFHEQVICAVDFITLEGNDYLISIGGNGKDAFELALWDLSQKHKRDAKTKRHKPVACGLASKATFINTAVNHNYTGSALGELLLVGKSQIRHIEFAKNDKKIEFKSGTIATREKMPNGIEFGIANAVCFLPSGLGIIGANNGVSILTRGRECVATVKTGDDASITAVAAGNGESFFAASNGKVFTVDVSTDEAGAVEAKETESRSPVPLSVSPINSEADTTATITALAFSNARNAILVGTVRNLLVEAKLDGSESRLLVAGHAGDSAALAAHPLMPLVATGGGDGSILTFNTATHGFIKSKSLRIVEEDSKEGILSMCFSHDGKFLAVGLSGGTFVLVNFDSMEILFNSKIAAEEIENVAWSPDDSLIAAASWDQVVYVLKMDKSTGIVDGEPVKLAKGNTAAVRYVQFSADGTLLRSVTRDYIISHWSTEDLKRTTKVDYDLPWDTLNCLVGWDVKGIYQPGMKGPDLNSVSRSPAGDAIAVGDDRGHVLLYRSPALYPETVKTFVEKGGHCEHVIDVEFAADGSALFSAGGDDLSVIQWAHEGGKKKEISGYNDEVKLESELPAVEEQGEPVKESGDVLFEAATDSKAPVVPDEADEPAEPVKEAGDTLFEDLPESADPLYKNGFHDRLSTDWPEERGQLHSGGWEQTKEMIAELGLDKPDVEALDLCCGEGQTATFIAKTYGTKVTGVDIVPKAIAVANKYAADEGVPEKAKFVVGDVEQLPFEDSFVLFFFFALLFSISQQTDSFDIVYGQDPDGLAKPTRKQAFAEAFRVLKPGGVFAFHHHWIPGFDFDAAELEALGDAADNCSADAYNEALVEVGFAVEKFPIDELASRHLRANFEAKSKSGNEDEWLGKRIASMDNGHKFGARFVCRKGAE